MEKKQENTLERYGLIGRNISYSFSAGYFKEKFSKLKLTNFSYQNFDLSTIEELKDVLGNFPDLKGFNVTIPYKEEIIPLLDHMSNEALEIGAVNTVKIEHGKLIGYNTDCFGFEHSLKSFLKPHHSNALVLGTGGASKAIAYVLDKLQINYSFVSRNPEKEGFTYNDLNFNLIQNHTVIINCTPLGTFPKTNEKPDIPYEGLTDTHLLYDLIYNPAETRFLALGREAGATVSNGLSMLELQAEKAWEIWRG